VGTSHRWCRGVIVEEGTGLGNVTVRGGGAGGCCGEDMLVLEEKVFEDCFSSRGIGMGGLGGVG
jgi:hypothetical protein